MPSRSVRTMLSRSDLRQIAKARLKDAEVLLLANRFDGAAYLCGYAMELGLKVRICKTLKWTEFPETNNDFRTLGLDSFKTHDLDRLLHLSGIEDKIKTNRSYLVHWSTVRVWSSESRYNRIGTANSQQVVDLINSTKILLKLL